MSKLLTEKLSVNSSLTSTSTSSEDKGMEFGANKGMRLRQTCIDNVDGDNLLFVDAHDDAIIGMTERDGEACVFYDQEKIIQALRHSDGLDKAGATEFFEYNIAGSWLGVGTPVFVKRMR